jgi:hypothetical protein
LLAFDVQLLPNESSYAEFLRLRKVPLVEAQLIAGKHFSLRGGGEKSAFDSRGSNGQHQSGPAMDYTEQQ